MENRSLRFDASSRISSKWLRESESFSEDRIDRNIVGESRVVEVSSVAPVYQGNRDVGQGSTLHNSRSQRIVRLFLTSSVRWVSAGIRVRVCRDEFLSETCLAYVVTMRVSSDGYKSNEILGSSGSQKGKLFEIERNMKLGCLIEFAE